MLKKMLMDKGWKGSLCMHVVLWDSPAYDQTNPYVIDRQLRSYKWLGVDRVIATWKGLTNLQENETAKQLVFECFELELQFALLMDPWICKQAKDKEKAVMDSLTDAAHILGSPAYWRDVNGKAIVLDFVTGADLGKLAQARPDLSFWKQHVDYSWPPANGGTQKALDYAKQVHKLDTIKLASLCESFLDAGYVDPATQKVDYGKPAWYPGEQNVRELPSLAGNFFFDQLATINKNTDIALMTANDRRERTSFWGDAAAIFSGIKIG